MKASMKAFAFAILAAVVVALAVVPADEASAEPSVELQTAGGNSYVTVTLDSVPLENPTLYVYDADGEQVASKQVVFAGSASVLLRFSGVVFEDSYTYELKSTTTTYFSGLKVGPAAYAVSVAETENGSVTVSAETAKAGDEVSVTATPADGYVLDKITVVAADGTGIAVTDGKFTMPSQAVTVFVTFKESTPAVEYSTAVRAALVVDDDGVYMMMVAKDGKAIPSGTITVTYSYTKTVTFHGQQRVTSATGSFTQEFAADGKANAYVLLDFEDKASENYDSVFGISAASFTYGETTVKAGSAAFALPPLAEAGA